MPQPIDLNLSSQPFRNNTLPWAGLIASCLALLSFTYWNASSYAEHKRLLSEVRDEKNSIAGQLIDLARREQQAFQFIRGYDLEGLTIQTDKANEVIGWKAFSWTRLFNRMELVQPWNVHMRSIQPMFRNDSRDRVGFFTDKSKSVMVAVEGVSKDVNALFEFERRLFEDLHFSQAEPEEYERTEKNEAIFTLRFRYYPLGKPGFESPVIAASQTVEGEAGDDDPTEQQAVVETPDEATETTETTGGRDLPRIQRPPRSDAPAAAGALDDDEGAVAEGVVGELGAEAEKAEAEKVEAKKTAAATAAAEKAAAETRPGPRRKAGVRAAGRGGQPTRIKRPSRATDRRNEDDGSQEPPEDDDDTSEERLP